MIASAVRQRWIRIGRHVWIENGAADALSSGLPIPVWFGLLEHFRHWLVAMVPLDAATFPSHHARGSYYVGMDGGGDHFGMESESVAEFLLGVNNEYGRISNAI
jgi:hypothetical protein